MKKNNNKLRKLTCPKSEGCDRFYKKDGEFYCFYHNIKAIEQKTLNNMGGE